MLQISACHFDAFMTILIHQATSTDRDRSGQPRSTIHSRIDARICMTWCKCIKANSAMRGTMQLPRVWSLALSEEDWFLTNHEVNGAVLRGFQCFQPSESEPLGKSCSILTSMFGNLSRSWQLSD